LKDNYFNNKERQARITVKTLLAIDAIHFNSQTPFTLTSGIRSPVYIDCRKLISHPKARRILMNFCADIILGNIGCHQVDGLVGGETAGIPFAAFLAERLNLPMHYVRKKPKGFGRDAQIEGGSIVGKKVILIEDLTTDGGSKIKFCNALRDAGAEVEHAIVIFYYNIFPKVTEKLEKLGIQLHYLASWWDVLKFCRDESSKWNNETLDQIEAFLDSPIEWSKQQI
tara:strand:+ start:401 stop:1078 length:678 start_codon:yes stop_codon:yes gene_type:complete